MATALGEVDKRAYDVRGIKVFKIVYNCKAPCLKSAGSNRSKVHSALVLLLSVLAKDCSCTVKWLSIKSDNSRTTRRRASIERAHLPNGRSAWSLLTIPTNEAVAAATRLAVERDE